MKLLRHKSRFLLFFAKLFLFLGLLFFVIYKRGTVEHSSSCAKYNVGSKLEATYQYGGVMVAVRSTSKYWWRLKVIHDTWYPFISTQTYVFIDEYTTVISRMFGDRLVVTGCPPNHDRKGLSCKLQAEFNHFMTRDASRWFCHLDDDMYLNPIKLKKMLRCFDPENDWYLGRHNFNKSHQVVLENTIKFKVKHGFPVGSSYCLTRPLVQKILAIIGNRNLMDVDRDSNDDIIVGYIVEYLMSVRMTEIKNMYHQYLPESSLQLQDLKPLITFASGLMNSSVARPKRFFIAHDYLINNEEDYVEYRQLRKWNSSAAT